jgi:hypothetical protein
MSVSSEGIIQNYCWSRVCQCYVYYINNSILFTFTACLGSWQTGSQLLGRKKERCATLQSLNEKYRLSRQKQPHYQLSCPCYRLFHLCLPYLEFLLIELVRCPHFSLEFRYGSQLLLNPTDSQQRFWCIGGQCMHLLSQCIWRFIYHINCLLFYFAHMPIMTSGCYPS